MTRKALAAVVPRMAKKVATDRSLNYRICAIAFSKRNNMLGIQMNSHRFTIDHVGRSGLHAEQELIRKFGRRISYIYILRVGNSGNPLPIHPCENCARIAAKYGIKIIPLHEELNLEEIL